jgi:hypothetical protein
LTQWDGEEGEGKIWTVEEFPGYYRIMREVPVRKKPGTETVPILMDEDSHWDPSPGIGL